MNDVVHLIFPKQCISCQRELGSNENHLCSLCDSQLTPTRFNLYEDPTPMDKLFWGRVNIHSTHAHYYFQKNASIQSVLFALKYKNGQLLGKHMGVKIGKALVESNFFESNAALIPIPLHPKKEFIRGYNQSFSIAQGISSSSGIPIDNKSVIRNTNNSTQTKKNRFQRWDNVTGIFKVNPSLFNHKHLVLIDDVVTTGSTIEALVKQIHEIDPTIRISVVTLAIT